MTAFLGLLATIAQKVLAGLAGEFLRQRRHDKAIGENTLLKSQIRSRKAIDRAKKTSERRDLGAVRDRLRERAGKR
ncbi:transcriptional regulator [Roseibium sp.]|uniref:transcriptional regulator n=1 Tax=Roseibium sp. TaxID=1936156 RepID=UPI003B51705A